MADYIDHQKKKTACYQAKAADKITISKEHAAILAAAELISKKKSARGVFALRAATAPRETKAQAKIKKELKEAREQIQNFQEQLDNIKAQDDYKSNYIQEL